ncbi:hypothetical protein K461DRAFT_313202 [Myriangium duriaei CBS 260.36]|uniref:Uncharacterized protein n=1 Tax=Myriangium duriaei CBS 260.36 TaxID=1168546 RepID=A0A9P4J1S4_9PEZI|nr:hypothetical protein K461DRAFT_313202 [Myriangium duriaei CBS 260.36]
MHRKQRWLWPSSESRFLKHGSYCNFSYTSYIPNPSDILLPGSDDEADEQFKKAKRRRITKLGRAYLAGQPLLIPSAILKGPFGVRSMEDMDIDESDSALPVLHPPASNDVLATSHELHLTSEIVARESDHARTTSDLELAETCIDPARVDPHTPPEDEFVRGIPHTGPRPVVDTEGLQEILAGIAEAKRLSTTVIGLEEIDLEGIQQAKRLSQAVLGDAFNGEEMGVHLEPPDVREAEQEPSEVVQKSPLKPLVHLNMSSPFVFRRGKLPKHMSDVEENLSPSNIVNPEEDNHDKHSETSESRMDDNGSDVQLPAELAQPSRIDYANARLSRFSLNAETPVSVKKRLREAMTASGASFECDEPKLSATPLCSPLQDQVPNPSAPRASRADVEATGCGMEAHENTSSLAEIQISTQAALREAHLDLLRSSPVKALRSPDKPSSQMTAKDFSLSPAPIVTPFANFHERFNATREVTRIPQLSTQNMLDTFSPFQFSPEKSQDAGRADQSHLAMPGEDGCPKDGHSTSDRTPGPFVSAHTGWSFEGLDGSTKSKKSGTSRGSSQRSKVSTGSQSQSNAGLKGMGFKITKSSQRTHAQSDKAKCTAAGGESSFARAMKDVNRSPSRLQSFSLSQILNDLSPIREGGQGFDKILSSSSHSLLRRTSVPSNTSRGQVLDWDNASVVSNDGEEQTVHDSNISKVKDSFNNHNVIPPSMPTQPSFGSFKSAKPRVRMSLGEPQLSQPISTRNTCGDDATGPSSTVRSSLKSALRKTQQSSLQDAQREPDVGSELDLDDSLNELGRSVLGSWDVDSAIRDSVQAI